MATHPHLIVGLGNPGPRYRMTRHNAGFLLVDRLLDTWSAKEVESNRLYCLWEAFPGDAWVQLMKPMTFMNLSGNALMANPRFLAIPREAMLVAYDDVALPLGHIRVRPKGSAGGQRGMRHIIECLGTAAIPRLRIGIGAPEPEGQSRADYVLDPFSQAEWSRFEAGLDAAVEAAGLWLTASMNDVMNRFNVKGTASASEAQNGDT